MCVHFVFSTGWRPSLWGPEVLYVVKPATLLGPSSKGALSVLHLSVPHLGCGWRSGGVSAMLGASTSASRTTSPFQATRTGVAWTCPELHASAASVPEGQALQWGWQTQATAKISPRGLKIRLDPVRGILRPFRRFRQGLVDAVALGTGAVRFNVFFCNFGVFSDSNGYLALPVSGRGVCTQWRRLSAGPWVRGSREGARSLGGSPKVLNQQTCQLSPQSGRNISPTHFICSLLSLLWTLLIIPMFASCCA